MNSSRSEVWNDGRMPNSHLLIHASTLPLFDTFRRLLWKELHEVKWFAAALIGVPTMLAASGEVLTYRGEMHSLGTFIWIAAGLLLGALAYSRELGWDTPRFLYSRPIPWWHVWVAKLGVGVAMCFVAALLPAIAYRLACAEAYLPFATVGALAKGASIAFLLTLGCFLLGFVSSVVAPGLSRTIVVVSATSTWTFIAAGWRFRLLVPFALSTGHLILAFPILLIASLRVARHLTQPFPDRAFRYGSTLAAGLLMVLLVTAPFNTSPRSFVATDVSPDADFIAATEWKSNEVKLLVLREHKANGWVDRTVDRAADLAFIGWSPLNASRGTQRFLYLAKQSATELHLKMLDARARTTHVLAKVPIPDVPLAYPNLDDERARRWHRIACPRLALWSPSGERFVFSLSSTPSATVPRPPVFAVGFLFDMSTGALRPIPREAYDLFGEFGATEAWWLNENELANAYAIRTQGKLRFFDVQTRESRDVPLTLDH